MKVNLDSFSNTNTNKMHKKWIEKFEGTKKVNKRRKSKKCRLYNDHNEQGKRTRRVEDTKGVIRIRKPKDRHYNGQKKKDKQWSTKLTEKIRDRVTGTSLKTGGELMCSRRVGSSCSTSGIRRVNLVTTPVMNDLQNTTQKTKDRVTRNQLKTRGEFGWCCNLLSYLILLSGVLPCKCSNNVFDVNREIRLEEEHKCTRV